MYPPSGLSQHVYMEKKGIGGDCSHNVASTKAPPRGREVFVGAES